MNKLLLLAIAGGAAYIAFKPKKFQHEPPPPVGDADKMAAFARAKQQAYQQMRKTTLRAHRDSIAGMFEEPNKLTRSCSNGRHSTAGAGACSYNGGLKYGRKR